MTREDLPDQSIHELDFSQSALPIGIALREGGEPWLALQLHELRQLVRALHFAETWTADTPGLNKLRQWAEGAIAYIERGGFPPPSGGVSA